MEYRNITAFLALEYLKDGCHRQKVAQIKPVLFLWGTCILLTYLPFPRKRKAAYSALLFKSSQQKSP